MRKLALLALLLIAGSAHAISKADLIACLSGQNPPSGVVCPIR